MSFRLLIECSKDIDSLSIDFSDGTSEVVESAPPKKKKKPRLTRDALPKYADETALDTSGNFGGISDEVVALPNIQDRDRDPSVAPELQNFEM